VLAPATAAIAHEGRHDGMSLVAGVRHVLTQPDHLAIIGVFVGVTVLGGWNLFRRGGAP